MTGQQQSARTDTEGEARSWVVRLASGRMTAEDADELRRWHAASPRHALAFAEAKRHWALLGDAARDRAAVPGAPVRTGPSRRWLLAGGMAAAAAGLGAVALRPPFELWTPLVDLTADYSTGIGETRTIAMANNVTVQLSTRSRLSLQPGSSDELRLALLGGEAVVAASTRPVTVMAGDGLVRAVAGRFNLRNDDGTVRVACLDGEVAVVCGGQTLTLQANQEADYRGAQLGAVKPADRDEVTAWQRGVLVFRNKELRYVLDEVNRYRAGKIVLLNREAGHRPVAIASFHLDRLDDVVTQMETLYRLTARRLPGGIVLLS
jgi:transmembrane sensor